MDDTDKRQQILKAAQECFARFGYEKTTLDDIGKSVGLNKASLYHYYESKDAMYADVIMKETDEFLATLLAGLASVKGCRRKIFAYLDAHLRYSQDTTSRHKLSLENLTNIRPIVGRLRGQMMKKEVENLSALLAEGVRKGELKKCDSSRVAKAILAITYAVKSRPDAGAEMDCAGQREEVDFAVGLMLDGLVRKAAK